jgi:hypothetical protein
MPRRFCGKVGADVTGDEDGGALVDDAQGLDYMLLFPLGVSRDSGGIFVVELPLLHWLGTFGGFAGMRQARGNASMHTPETMNGACRARQAQPRRLASSHHAVNSTR